MTEIKTTTKFGATTVMRECGRRNGSSHGMTPHYVRASGPRCVKCSKARDRSAMTRTPEVYKRGQQKRAAKLFFKLAIAREYLGGECSNSNCNHNCPTHLLQFHHPIPKKGHEKAISQMINSCAPTKDIWAELDKTVLLCPICHLAHHSSQEGGPHGETPHEMALKGSKFGVEKGWIEFKNAAPENQKTEGYKY